MFFDDLGGRYNSPPTNFDKNITKMRLDICFTIRDSCAVNYPANSRSGQ